MINIYFLSENECVSARIIISSIGLSISNERPNNKKVELVLAREYVKLNFNVPTLIIQRADDIKLDIQKISEEIISDGKLNINHLQRKERNYWIIDLDILSIVENVISREEEMNETVFDEHQRYRVASSLLFNTHILDRPIINYIIEFMKDVIDVILRVSKLVMPYITRWRDDFRFAVSITVDLDNLRRYPLPISFVNPLSAIKYLNMKNIKKHLEVAYRSVSNNNKVITDIDKMLDFSGVSLTLFACGKRRHGIDPEVSAKDYRASFIIKSLLKIGVEIALHGSYLSMFDCQKLSEERQLLEDEIGRSVEGIRMHYLRLKVPDTLVEISKSGFIYDSSMAYPNLNGFRAGIALPFKVFNYPSLYELPPSIMDSSLFFRQKLNYEDALIKSIDIISELEKVNGYSVFIFHNQHLVYDEYKMIGKLLKDLRDDIAKRNGVIINCSEAIRWWKARKHSSFILFKDDTSFLIKFDITPIILKYGRLSFLGDINRYSMKTDETLLNISENIKCNVLSELKGVFRLVRSRR
ncbi:MAG: DUF7033 domain-containing protein [bacterium]